MEHSLRLIISCPDNTGIIAQVTHFIADHGGTITESNNYSDPESGWFFMRQVIRADSFALNAEQLREAFKPIAEHYRMDWQVTDTQVKKRVVVMASKQQHCLKDLLYRWHSQDMDFDLCCVINNHQDLRDYVAWHELPYEHIPVPIEPEGKAKAFALTQQTIDSYEPDVIVLARYMQILPESLCEKYSGQIINIHHSFLPSFVGAKPYHQAQQKGVKLIGATCHYVTQELDQGPIIEQDVVRVTHHDSVEDMVRLGKDVERSVLARGLRYHLEDRVLIHGNKTIVFS